MARMWKTSALFLAALVILSAAGCISPGDPLMRTGDEIIVAGQLFHTGTPVVLWLDPGGYDAYRARRHFDPKEYFPSAPVDPGNPNRYSSRYTMPEERKVKVAREGWTLENLQEQVDQFVFHYDACGTSAQCFYILQDVRGLSVQFMCDLDGTIYQTLDLKERAWHANNMNCRCVGVEIANIGAYKNMDTLDKWYSHDEDGWPFVTFPEDFTHPEQRTPDFVARPARKDVISGTINGSTVMQYDYTDEQYKALIKLTAAMARVFPRITLDVPRNPDGSVRMEDLSNEELKNYSGFLGHQHIIKQKVDPGPAFDWERILDGAKQEIALSL